MDGTWTYYDRKGKTVQEIIYIKGKAQNQDELNEKEQKAFRKFEENKHRLMDPAKFMNDPQKYMRESGSR